MRKNKTRHLLSTVIANKRMAEGFHFITFSAPGVALTAVPGQFVMIKPENCREPLLKRAFSIADTGKGTLSVYFEIKGSGTLRLSALRPGDRVFITGPLGKGFDDFTFRKENICIAGGCGLAPLLFLSKRLREKGRRVRFFYGARSANCQPMIPIIRKCCNTLIRVTDDGSAGKKGLVIDHVTLLAGAAVFACGPRAMLKAVAAKFPNAALALETPMACGMGICMGCAVRMADNTLRLCCKDGPVFKASEVAWD